MDRKKQHVEKRVVLPKSHPPAWGSALWQHVDTIRSMRRSRKKWREIAEYLTEEKCVPISPSAVRNFFARATDPHRPRPLGFEPIPIRTAESEPLRKSSEPAQVPTSVVERYTPKSGEEAEKEFLRRIEKPASSTKFQPTELDDN